MATSAPCSARAIAIARPMPRDPPVTRATLPLSSFMTSSRSGKRTMQSCLWTARDGVSRTIAQEMLTSAGVQGLLQALIVRSRYNSHGDDDTPSLGACVPARVGPELAAHRGVVHEEADRAGDLLRPDQPAQLRVRENVLFNELRAQRPHHRRVGEAGVDDGTLHAVIHPLLHQRRRRALDAALGGGVGDLALVALRGDGTDEDGGPLELLVPGLPAPDPATMPILRDPRDHLQYPINGRDQVDFGNESK